MVVFPFPRKIPCASQNTEAKTLPADDVCVFDCFEQLSPAAVHSER